jgi:hypothetical protein
MSELWEVSIVRKVDRRRYRIGNCGEPIGAHVTGNGEEVHG